MRWNVIGWSLVAGLMGLVGTATAVSPHDPELVCLREDHGFTLKDIPTPFVAIHFLGAPGSEEATKALAAYRERLWEVAGVYHVFVCRGERTAEHDEWAKGIPADRLMIAMDADGKLATELEVSPSESATVVLNRAGEEVVREVRTDAKGWMGFAEFAKAMNEKTRAEVVKEYNLPKGSVLAVEGYDVVSYFADAKAVKGKKELVSWFNGVEYRFATAEHREAFARKPEKYLPTYGGWCASAMGAKGTKVEIDPTNFKVKDGRLFLFYKSAFGDALKDWNKHEAEWEPKADQNWERVSGEKRGG